MNASGQAQHSSNHYFDDSKSSTFKLVNGANFSISYDAGQVYANGLVGTDTVSCGAATVQAMPFGLGTDISQQGMVDSTYDGLLGLAFGFANTLTPTKGPTFMEGLQSSLDSPVFTFNLPLGNAVQMLEFGHVDKTLYSGSLQQVAIKNGSADGKQPSGWFATASYAVNGKTISSAQQQTLFDTGGLAALAHPDAVAAYWATVQGAKDLSKASDGSGWSFPCATTPSDLTMNFVAPDGSVANATIPGKFLNGTGLFDATNDPGMCTGAFQSDKGGSGTVGYPFFHSMFTVFDQSKPQIGFAPYSSNQNSAGSGGSSASGSASASGSTSATASGTGAASTGSSAQPTGTTTPIVRTIGSPTGTAKASVAGPGSVAATGTAAGAATATASSAAVAAVGVPALGALVMGAAVVLGL